MTTRRTLLRFREDRRSVAFVVVALALLTMPYVWSVPSPLAPLWIAVTMTMCFASSIVNHNHMHRAVFVAPAHNVVFNLALTLARGHAASDVVVPHNLNHHREANRETDWIRPALAGTGIGWVRLLRYVVRASGNMVAERLRREAPSLPHERRLSMMLEKTLLVGAIVLAAWSDWRTFALFNALPWLGGLVMLVGINLLQHDGCARDVVVGDSRDFTGALGNWLFLNNGFHSAHHVDPERHWSELPALHARLATTARTEEHASVLGYLWRFGWSRTS